MLDELMADVNANSAAGSKESHLRTWTTYHKLWFGDADEVFPLSVAKILCVAAIFKKARYRSFPNYLSTVRQEHISRGFDITQQIDQASRWASKSVTRGIGPSRQSASISITKVSKLHDQHPVSSGIAHNREAFVIGAMWILREIELSFSLVSDIVVDKSALEVSWHLPASKTDPQAKGCWRTLGCCCTPSYDFPCPYHYMVGHLENLVNMFSQERVYTEGFPLFPSLEGKVVTKRKVIEGYEALAVAIGMSIVVDGISIIGGHSTRVTGAQFWAALGLEIRKIAALGRWGSEVVMRYVAEAPLRAVTADLRRLIAEKARIVGDEGRNREVNSRLMAIERLLQSGEVRDNEKQAVELVQPDASSQPLPIADEGVEHMADTSHEVPAPATYVVNIRSKKVHLLSFSPLGVPVSEHHCKCGWKFSGSRYMFVQSIDQVFWNDICDTCLPNKRASLMEEQAPGLSDISDSSDSS